VNVCVGNGCHHGHGRVKQSSAEKENRHPGLPTGEEQLNQKLTSRVQKRILVAQRFFGRPNASSQKIFGGKKKRRVGGRLYAMKGRWRRGKGGNQDKDCGCN